MNATSLLGDDYDRIQMDSLVGVKEAASLVGARPSNFVRDFANQPGFPAPVAQLGSGRIWLASQVESYAENRRQHRLGIEKADIGRA
jgi:hypothetical protein